MSVHQFLTVDDFLHHADIRPKFWQNLAQTLESRQGKVTAVSFPSARIRETPVICEINSAGSNSASSSKLSRSTLSIATDAVFISSRCDEE